MWLKNSVDPADVDLHWFQKEGIEFGKVMCRVHKLLGQV